MEEIEKGLKLLKGFATPQEEPYQQPDPPKPPRDEAINQGVHLAPEAHVAEDSLMRYQWEERSLDL